MRSLQQKRRNMYYSQNHKSIFYPETDLAADCIILELKIGVTPQEAIRQIKERNYALRFKEKLGKEKRYTGRILAVGISYNKDSKKHRCAVEVL